MLNLANFHILTSPDDGAGDAPEEPKTDERPKKVEFTPEQQAEIDRLVGATRRKEREKAKAEFDAERARVQEEANKAALQEQGRYKELAEAAEKEKLAANQRAEQAAKEASELKLQIAFEDAAEELDVVFVSKQAAKDAFKFLNLETVGEDGANMKKALESLKKERPYLFLESEEAETTDAKRKGQRPAREVLDKEWGTELKSRYRIRRPR